ncbi:MAG: family 43 glycosylhydrolase [Clostridia bacterium]|nr:family 43 glycosylhydrolase [Clostridia bacterium]
MLKRKDIRVRDPYIVNEGGRYYLYATTGERTMSCYVSDDLENWDEGGVAFEIPEDFWAYRDVWASEVHKYKGKFYLFVSLLGHNGLRATQICVCDTPKGPFLPITDHGATPAGQSCIDGTLYVDGDTPYVVYSHDWPDCYDAEKGTLVGEICAARLTPDLTEIVGEPWMLFTSAEAPISAETPHRITWEGKPALRYGSDAPFLQKLSNGSLYLTWSPYLHDNYVVLGAVSESGDIRGPWKHLDKPLFDRNGGHAMFFDRNDGKRIMCLHAPESHLAERANLFVVEEKDGALVIAEELQ